MTQSAPWSPAEAEQKLASIVDELDSAVADLKDMALKSARDKHAFELKEAREFTKVRSTGAAQEEAKRRALVACDAEYLEHLLSESVARSAGKLIDVRKAQADALRSLLVSARGVSS